MGNLFSKLSSLAKYEPLFFLLITVIHLLPLLLLKFFPALDGAPHLHNANLIVQLLWEGNSELSKYYQINPLPVPNWSGHLILAFFGWFLPGFIAEKILLIGYVFGFAYAFRHLIRDINPGNVVLSYLAFPFMYTFVLFLGFYNFSIGIVFMMLTLSFWIKGEGRDLDNKGILLLGLLFLLTYFSHLLVFGVLILLLVLRMLYQLVMDVRFGNKGVPNVLKQRKGRIINFLIAAALPMFLTLYYFFSMHSFSGYKYLPVSRLFGWLFHIRPLIVFHHGKEKPFTLALFLLLLTLLISGVYKNWQSNGIQSHVNNKNVALSAYWLFSALFICLLYFILPASEGAAGFISVRLCYIFFLLMIFWIASYELPKWTKVLALAVTLIANFGSNIIYSENLSSRNKQVNSVHEVAEYIEPNALILPVMNNEHWKLGHYSNYLGIDKPLVILENYECSAGYFPLVWNNEDFSNTLFGKNTSEDYSCLSWPSNPENEPEKIDYVFTYRELKIEKDPCNRKIKETLDEHYNKIYRNELCQLYELKEKQ